MALDISRITDTVYIAAHPRAEDAELLRSLPAALMLSMRMRPPDVAVRQAVQQWMHLPCIDSPLTPIPMLLLWRGVDAAVPVAREGGKVVVHCHYGRHRSVALACCILVGLGHPAVEAMALVKRQRAEADPYAWYIRARILQFEQNWT